MKLVPVGDEAYMPPVDNDFEWQLRYGQHGLNPGSWKRLDLQAASYVAAYNYLITSCSLKEATRRLSILKKDWKKQKSS